MSEFEIIQETQNADQIAAEDKLIDERIANASRQLNSLETKEMKLNKELKTTQKKLADYQKNNARLQTVCNKNVEPFVQPNQGSFFIQLRQVEAEVERCEQSRDGMKAVVTNLKGEITKENIKNNRLLSKVEDLRAQEESVRLDTTAKNGQLGALTTKLDEVSTECNELKHDVEETKKKLKDLASRMKDLSPQETALLISQKETLTREVKNKMKILDDRQNDERIIKTKFQMNQTKRNKNLTNISAPSNWINERATLLAKVKKLRSDLKCIDNQQRGLSQTQAKAHEVYDELNYSADDIKNSIIAEIDSIPKEMPEFWQIAFTIEMEQSDRFDKDIRDIENTIAEIAKFKTDTSSFMKLDETMAENNERINLLKEELTELRAKAS